MIIKQTVPMVCKEYPVMWEKIPIGSKSFISQITQTEIKMKLEDPTYAGVGNDSNAKGTGDGLKKLLVYFIYVILNVYIFK